MKKLSFYFLAFAIVIFLGNCGSSKKGVSISDEEKQTYIGYL
jgi:hypothetical protein